MLLEFAEVEVRPGAEDQFAQAMRETGIPQLAACEGVVSVRFGRGVENPSKFTFNVVWTSLDAHMAARDLESFGIRLAPRRGGIDINDAGEDISQRHL